MTIRIASKYTFYDVEASGLYDGSFPVEIAWSIYGEVKSLLIFPCEYWSIDEWDHVAQSIHGHPLHVLRKNGLSVSKIADKLNGIFGSQTVYSDNSAYDVRWTDMVFEAASVKRSFKIDTVGRLLGSLGVSAETAYESFSNARDTKPSNGAASQGVHHLKAVVDDLQKRGVLKA